MSDAPPPPPPPGPWSSQPPPPPSSGIPGYGTPGYGTPPPPGFPAGYAPGAFGAPQRVHPSGTTVLTLGVLGLVFGFFCGVGFVLSPIAWFQGGRARRQMREEPSVVWTNAGNVTAGWVCGIIGTVMLMIGLLLIVLLLLIAMAAGS